MCIIKMRVKFECKFTSYFQTATQFNKYHLMSSWRRVVILISRKILNYYIPTTTFQKTIWQRSYCNVGTHENAEFIIEYWYETISFSSLHQNASTRNNLHLGVFHPKVAFTPPRHTKAERGCCRETRGRIRSVRCAAATGRCATRTGREGTSRY